MNRSTIKTSVSIPKSLLEKAKKEARKKGFGNSFSAYIQKLVADDLGVTA